MTLGHKTYLDKDVYSAARERLRFVFERFERVCVALSGGKDSTVLTHLAIEVGREMGRLPLHAMFIDLEAQFQATIDHVEQMFAMPELRPWWICLPLNLRNASSVREPHWCCWEPGREDRWVRRLPNHSAVMSDPSALPFYRHRMEFEEFVPAFNDWLATDVPTAFLVGIRADESLNRFKAVRKREGGKKCAWNDIPWSSVTGPKARSVSFFPIYDWRFEDLWKYVASKALPYNKLYDWMYLTGMPFSQMRICQPYGDDQRKGLDLFHRAEPETWARVVQRVDGANWAAHYARQKMLGYQRGTELPAGHTWMSYTFYLLSTVPDVMRERYLSNFAVFLEWWSRHGYPLDKVFLDETPARRGRKGKLPSWRRLALAILKSDFNCKSLTIGPIKDVFADVYSRVENGEPVKVRKSVRPFYEHLREQYGRYLQGGIEAVHVDYQPSSDRLDEIKEKYRSL